MAKGKIAPVLAQVVKWSAAGEDARREYRALVAVAKIVRAAQLEVLHLARHARGAHPGELDGDEVGRALEGIHDVLGERLARLDRVSGGKP